MILGKIQKYILLLALGGLLSCAIYLKVQNSKIKQENIELLQGKKKEIKHLRDSVLIDNKKRISRHLNQLDSVIKIRQEIKYIKYEKYRYVDRTLDDALLVLSNYTYKRATKKDSTVNNSR